MKKLLLILGDQLSHESDALRAIDRDRDEICMIEASSEARHVWSNKARIALFLSAMRHFAEELRERGFRVNYIYEADSIASALTQHFKKNSYQQLLVTEPGEVRIRNDLRHLSELLGVSIEFIPDNHFYCSIDDFKHWAAEKKELRLEFFYRMMRKKHQVLMDPNGDPVGGQWNFDQDNRRPYPRQGPGFIDEPLWFEPDDITSSVIEWVQKTYPDHPGNLSHFNWPVTRDQALKAMNHFMEHRLGNFGYYQDAMWTDTPFGWHSILSAALNLKLIAPREVVDAALMSYQSNQLELSTVEGFIRQILGWREFVRGVYFLDMPKLATDNHFKHTNPLPQWYWTGQSRMKCMSDSVGQTIQYGYAHHIQRLMVTGNFALLAEILPQEVAQWYLAMYVDAVEWVELPNVAGMALFANGGRFTSKPYVASGMYIKRMSNYCQSCPYKPDLKHGGDACPVTVLYWNFLIKHQESFSKNPRTSLMVRNLSKVSADDQLKIQDSATRILGMLDDI